MAEEEEENAGANLDEEREQIRQLQSEQARKTEALRRLEQKIDALKSEKDARQREMDKKRVEYENEMLRGNTSKAKDSNASNQAKEQAVSDYMKNTVRKMLQDRIPILKEDNQETEELLAVQDHGGEQQEEAAGGKDKVHDSVLVSYINYPSEGKAEDYKVSYRIDRSTTVQELHKDACSYWGCSPHDFVLCKTDGQEITDLFEAGLHNAKLQESKVLNPEEEAHLHLINAKSLERFKEQRKVQEEKQNAKPKKEEEEEANQGKLKTLRHGTGMAVNEHPDEAFVESLKPWPGVYNLLRYRKRSHPRRSDVIKCRDIFLFGFVAILSGFAMMCRNSRNFFYLNQGAQAHLLTGPVNFHGIRQYEEIWSWIATTVQPQLFNNESALRQHYTPAGFMRIRHQRAKEKECARSIAYDVKMPCYYVEVSDSTQQMQELIYAPGQFINLTIPETGRMQSPDPRIWRSAEASDIDLDGHMQSSYQSSGYMIDYSFNAENISTAGETLLSDLPHLADSWVTTNTRMIAVEFVLANFNLHGYVSISCLIEFSPSGAIYTSATFLPFSVGTTYSDDVADVLDIFRAIVVVLYILIIRMAHEFQRKVKEGHSGVSYFLSFLGMVDLSIVVVFLAMKLQRITSANSSSPFNDITHTSYRKEGSLFHQLVLVEGIVFLVVMLRWASFMRILSPVFRFWNMFSRSIVMFGYFCTIYLPVVLGLIFMGNAIWNPYLEGFSTWTWSFISTLAAIRHRIPVEQLYVNDRVWTLPFITYFFLSMTAFFVNAFLAITAYAYFEVELLDGSKAEGATDDWGRDQWLDWMLWGPVYKMVTGNDPGASQEIADDGNGDGEEDDEDDDDADEK